MIYFLLLIPLVVVVLGVVLLVVYFLLMLRSHDIIDVDVNCLSSDINTIKSTTKKYIGKVRGSVRLQQGRIKTKEDAYSKEEKIFFP